MPIGQQLSTQRSPKGKALVVSTKPQDPEERRFLRTVAARLSSQGQGCQIKARTGCTELIVA
ncbi:MAG: hypothetical protein GF365_02360 [Candidatus Buchananbacteria bacterium]|nr:hypothetical protein [Candidatus Buchananbacteria bacterium]